MIFALIAFGLAACQFPAVNSHQATLTYALAAVVTTVVFFASLLAHELAHSLVARHYGLTVNSITLWLFGGVSELSGEAPSPAAEAQIAAAGPLASLLLSVVFVGLALLVGTGHPARASIPGVIVTALAYLGAADVMLAIFNVIPAAPLDGGRQAAARRHLVAHRRPGEGHRVGQPGRPGLRHDLHRWRPVPLLPHPGLELAVDLADRLVPHRGGHGRGPAGRPADRLRGIRASQIMTPDPVTVPGSMMVSEFIDDYLFRARHQSFPVTRDGTDTVCGLVTLDRIKHVPAGQRDRTRLADITCPLADVATAAPEDSVADLLLPRLTECAGRRALVFSDGHLAGIITPSDITCMMDRLSAAIAGASTHRRLFTISTFTSTHQFRLRDSEPRRLEHASAAVDCLAAPGST